MDMYLRILKANFDEKVVDRDVIRSQQVKFVNCFYIYVTISMGENKSSTKRVTIKQKFITYSIRTIYSGTGCSTNTRFIRTVSFVPTKSSYIFSKINPLYTDTG